MLGQSRSPYRSCKINPSLKNIRSICKSDTVSKLQGLYFAHIFFMKYCL